MSRVELVAADVGLDPGVHQAVQAAPAPATTPAEARKLAEGLMELMNALLAVIEHETELVRAGNVREAIKLESKKTELSRRYIASITALKAGCCTGQW